MARQSRSATLHQEYMYIGEGLGGGGLLFSARREPFSQEGESIGTAISLTMLPSCGVQRLCRADCRAEAVGARSVSVPPPVGRMVNDAPLVWPCAGVGLLAWAALSVGGYRKCTAAAALGTTDFGTACVDEPTSAAALPFATGLRVSVAAAGAPTHSPPLATPPLGSVETLGCGSSCCGDHSLLAHRCGMAHHLPLHVLC